MYLGMIAGRVIVAFLYLYRGKSGVCRSDSAGDQLDITQETMLTAIKAWLFIASKTIAKFLPSTKDGKAMSKSPNINRGIVNNFPRKLRGTTSPYPTVLIVTNANQAVCGIESNILGSPSASTNPPKFASHDPLSAK
jgi:hypothetical protein